MEEAAVIVDGTRTLNVAVQLDNEVLGKGLEAVLQSLPTVGKVYKSESHDASLTLVRDEGVDVIIVGAAEAVRLESAAPRLAAAGTRVLVLVDETAKDPFGGAPMPADGFLSQQDLSANGLQDALHRCVQGELPMPPVLARALLARADVPVQRQRDRHVGLTNRELETLSLLVRGMSNKQIARRLAISSHGAKRLVASIMLKLDSPNRTTAVVNAIKAGIIDYD
jgi:two-component system nitrate/nitrite response regulator NarL